MSTLSTRLAMGSGGRPCRAILRQRRPAGTTIATRRFITWAACILVLAALGSASAAETAADPYLLLRERILSANAMERRVPVIPPKDQKLRVIIDADAHNEIDDVWAIALALLSPERFQIEGFVAANYDNANEGAGPRSVATSAQTIHTLLEKAGLAGKIPVKLGSAPMRYQFEPSESEGVDFIIEKAMASTPEDPLWLIGLGAATDIASAYLKEPRIADRVVVFWHGRTQWPHKANNFNVHGDVRAARRLFHSNLAFVLFDTGSELFCPMEESEQWVETGELGRYLHEFRYRGGWYQSPTKGFYDLGDIAALIDPALGTWEVVKAPEVGQDLVYHFKDTKGKILRCAAIDRDGTFALFTRKLQGKSGAAARSSKPRVIFDTDVGGDIDDAGAFAVMHALADRGEIEILAVGVVNGHPSAVPYADALNTWFGRPDLPVGVIKANAPFAKDFYMEAVVPDYPHDLRPTTAPDVVSLYRKVLAAQPDRSVTLVAVGPATNISKLLDSTADEYSSLNGVDLVRQKVKFYAAGGNGDGKLPHGKPGWNYQMDVPSAGNELDKFPAEVPMIFAGGSGWGMKIGSCYGEAEPDHIVRKSFEAYFKGERDMDRPTWDQLRMLYACRPASRAKFETSAAGEIVMDEKNFLHWSESPRARRSYAYVKDGDAVRAELTELMMHVPTRWR